MQLQIATGRRRREQMKHFLDAAADVRTVRCSNADRKPPPLSLSHRLCRSALSMCRGKRYDSLHFDRMHTHHVKDTHIRSWRLIISSESDRAPILYGIVVLFTRIRYSTLIPDDLISQHTKIAKIA